MMRSFPGAACRAWIRFARNSACAAPFDRARGPSVGSSIPLSDRRNAAYWGPRSPAATASALIRAANVITMGRPDLHLREMGARINSRMGLNTWAAFAGSDEMVLFITT